jgi:hypothetical protein
VIIIWLIGPAWEPSQNWDEVAARVTFAPRRGLAQAKRQVGIFAPSGMTKLASSPKLAGLSHHPVSFWSLLVPNKRGHFDFPPRVPEVAFEKKGGPKAFWGACRSRARRGATMCDGDAAVMTAAGEARNPQGEPQAGGDDLGDRGQLGEPPASARSAMWPLTKKSEGFRSPARKRGTRRPAAALSNPEVSTKWIGAQGPPMFSRRIGSTGYRRPGP